MMLRITEEAAYFSFLFINVNVLSAQGPLPAYATSSSHSAGEICSPPLHWLMSSCLKSQQGQLLQQPSISSHSSQRLHSQSSWMFAPHMSLIAISTFILWPRTKDPDVRGMGMSSILITLSLLNDLLDSTNVSLQTTRFDFE